MEINAYEKIKKALTDACCDFAYETCDLLDETNEEAKEWLLGTYVGGEVQDFRRKHPHSKISAKKYLFENGLNFFNIEYLFRNENGNPCVKRDISLTFEFEILARVIFQSEQKLYRNTLTSEEDTSDSISIGKRKVEISTAEVYVGNTCESSFTTYTDLTNCTLLQEVYTQGFPISKQSDNANLLLAFCGNHDRELTILYQDSKPVQAQLSGNYNLKDAGYNPNFSEDTLKIVGVINQEVDAICEKIQSLVDNHVKEQNSVQKTIGTNPNQP